MIPVSASSTPAAAGAQLPGPTPLSSLDFLKILVAEFQNQDPTAPSDPTTFATQLVQFANLGQLENIDQAVQTPASTGLMQAASAYLGRQVVAAGSQIGVKDGKATSIVYSPVSADSYTAIISNSSGAQVDSVDLGSLQAGSLQTFTWKPGSSIADGAYAVTIESSKQAKLSGLLEQGVVRSVALSNGAVELDLGNLTIAGGAVTTVAQP